MSPVRIGSGALRGRRPVAGRPVRNGKVAGSNPAGSTTCGMPPRVSADIPRNDVTSRRRAPAMGYADSGLPPAARETAGPAGPSAGRPVRMWCSGSTPASQAGDRGFEPRHPRSIRKTKTMDLIRQWDSQPSFPCGRFRKTWTNSPGMGTQRQGIRKHAIAPVAQRKSRCLLSTGSGYRNSVGARCLVNRQA